LVEIIVVQVYGSIEDEQMFKIYAPNLQSTNFYYDFFHYEQAIAKWFGKVHYYAYA
jgi:hypothetical protein